MSDGSFAGFPPDGLAFLRELAAHNDRAWFQDNRARYEDGALGPMRALVADLVTRFVAIGVPLTADPARAVFRIHRDVRFSRDKSPYKTNVAAVMNRDGGKGTAGVLYLHVDPLGSFAASGFYQPDPAALAALRAAIVGKPKPLQAALDAMAAGGVTLSTEDSLTRMPRGFEAQADSPQAPMLRLRHLIGRLDLPPASLASAALVDELVRFTQACLPLLRFGWAATG